MKRQKKAELLPIYMAWKMGVSIDIFVNNQWITVLPYHLSNQGEGNKTMGYYLLAVCARIVKRSDLTEDVKRHIVKFIKPTLKFRIRPIE
jgi:hypothetical protein